MESNNMQQQPETADQEIDLIELAQKLWQGRRMIVRWCIAGALAGLVIGFSIPKEYTVTVKLAPEIQGGKTSLGGLGSLASIAGINMEHELCGCGVSGSVSGHRAVGAVHDRVVRRGGRRREGPEDHAPL